MFDNFKHFSQTHHIEKYMNAKAVSPHVNHIVVLDERV